MPEEKRRTLETFKRWQGETVRLNVGGRIFETTISTLRRSPGSLFDDLFDGEEYKQLITRDDGTLFIDRCPEYFSVILNQLRNPESPSMEPEDSLGQRLLKLERQYYRLLPVKQEKE